MPIPPSLQPFERPILGAESHGSAWVFVQSALRNLVCTAVPVPVRQPSVIRKQTTELDELLFDRGTINTDWVRQVLRAASRARASSFPSCHSVPAPSRTVL